MSNNVPNIASRRDYRPDRPGGITVLAIVTGCAILLRLITIGTIYFAANFLANLPDMDDPEIEMLVSVLKAVPDWAMTVAYVLQFAAVGAAIAATLGLWFMHPFWGRWGANLYGLLGVAAILHWAYNGPDHPEFGGGFTFGTVADLFGPVFLLCLINTIFARDFKYKKDSDEGLADDLQTMRSPGAQPGFLGHLFEIANETYRSSMRSAAGLSFLLITIFLGLVTARSLILPLEMLQGRYENFSGGRMSPQDMDGFTDEMVDSIKDTIVYMVVEARYDKNNEGYSEKKEAAERWGDYLGNERPHVLSAFHMIMMLMIPLLIGSGVFNLFAEDAKERRLRFFLIRTTRLRLMLGRFLGASFLVITALVPIFALVGLYMATNVSTFESGEVVVWTTWGFCASVMMILPYVALAAGISAAVDSPWAALAILTAVIGIMPVAAIAGASYWAPIGNFIYWQPWWVQFKLLHPDTGTVIFAALMCLGYTAAYLALGFWNFKYRDV